MATAWRYGARPDKALRWYPEGAWLGWRPLGSPVAYEFETIDGFSLTEYLERVRTTGTVESDFLLPPKSGDSWGSFINRHGAESLFKPWVPEHRVRDQSRAGLRARVTAEQEAWEQARLERMRLKQQDSDAEWAEAQRKVDAAAHVLALQQAEERAKREAEAAKGAAIRLEAERRRDEARAAQYAALEAQQRDEAERRKAAAAKAKQTRGANREATERARQEMARFRYAAESPDRMHWLSLFQHTLSELRGSKYEALMPEMERDMRTIVEYPPGPLPWRLDRDVFYRSLAEKKAKIDRNG